MNRIIIKSTEN